MSWWRSGVRRISTNVGVLCRVLALSRAPVLPHPLHPGSWLAPGGRLLCAGKQTASRVKFDVPAKCACNRCQIMRVLVERYEQVADKVEGVPRISSKHVAVSFARSGGAGGQNVNKVNTKVDMRFRVMDAAWLPERVRVKVMELERSRINKEGEIVVSSSKTRSQKDNVEDALGKLQQIIDSASAAAPSEKQRIEGLLLRLAKGRGR